MARVRLEEDRDGAEVDVPGASGEQPDSYPICILTGVTGEPRQRRLRQAPGQQRSPALIAPEPELAQEGREKSACASMSMWVWGV